MFTTIQEKIFIILQKIGNSIFIYAPKKELLLEIRNKPLVKLFFKSIIIGSLLLIITKLILSEYLNIWSRIMLLGLYIGIAMILELREKIKMPIAFFLRFLLGYAFYAYNDDLEKEDFLIAALPEGVFTQFGFYRSLHVIKFEIAFFLYYIFQRFYIAITYIRLFFDIHPLIYIIIYYNILFAVLYFDITYIITYIGLIIIITKLFTYISENNFSEVKQKLIEKNFNLNLTKTKLKLTKKNVMLFLFWNIRNIDIIDYTSLNRSITYTLSVHYLQNRNEKYFFSSPFAEELPFDYVEKDIPLIFFMFSFIYKEVSDTINNIIKIKALVQPKLEPNVEKLITRANFHDSRQKIFTIDTLCGKKKFIEIHTTFTSALENKSYLTPLGSIYAAPHSNGNINDSTHEVPLFYLEADSLEELKNKSSLIFKLVRKAKYIHEALPFNLNYKNAIYLSFEEKKIEPNEKKDLLDSVITGIITIKGNSKYNLNGDTLGGYYNAIIENKFDKANYILKNVASCMQETFNEEEKKAKSFLAKQGIYNPTEVQLEQIGDYKKVKTGLSEVKEISQKQIILMDKMHIQLLKTVKKYDSDSETEIIGSITNKIDTGE